MQASYGHTWYRLFCLQSWETCASNFWHMVKLVLWILLWRWLFSLGSTFISQGILLVCVADSIWSIYTSFLTEHQKQLHSESHHMMTSTICISENDHTVCMAPLMTRLWRKWGGGGGGVHHQFGQACTLLQDRLENHRWVFEYQDTQHRSAM